jgi:hypothetical protein
MHNNTYNNRAKLSAHTALHSTYSTPLSAHISVGKDSKCRERKFEIKF